MASVEKPRSYMIQSSLSWPLILKAETSEAWHSKLRGMMTGGAVWSVGTGRRVADFACMASIWCAWGVGLCWDVALRQKVTVCNVLVDASELSSRLSVGMYTSLVWLQAFLLQLSCPCRQ
eukprot:76391-Pelagomonas_calceolata.AAC.1